MRHELFVGWFDFYAARASERLAGLTDAEYLWEPVPGCWSIRPGPSGFVVDGADPEPDPPPVTTIAWRLVHVCASLNEHWLRAVAFERGRADFHLPTNIPGTRATRSRRSRRHARAGAPTSRTWTTPGSTS